MSSLYLHIPFCSQKCPYCDFFSQVGSQQQIDEYVDLLNLNLQILKRKEIISTPFRTIFFGGGTPSLLSVKQIENILTSIEKTFGMTLYAEITLEANPGTITLEQLQGYRQAGVNRLSLGIQSLNDQNLQRLGRIHSACQSQASIVAARAAGFENLNLDLMFALPNQDLQLLETEILNLLTFNPEHISLYGLSFEEGTEFFSQLQAGKIVACEENLYAEQYKILHERLIVSGYDHYEISNFARSGKRCHHNQIYWQRESCLAIGAGAHRFVEKEWGERWHIPANLKHYSNSLLHGKDPAELLERYDHYGAMKEYVYLGLRTANGVDLNKFEQKFNLPMRQVFPSALDKIADYLCLHSGSERYSFNLKGWLLYDHLISHFL